MSPKNGLLNVSLYNNQFAMLVHKRDGLDSFTDSGETVFLAASAQGGERAFDISDVYQL